MAEKLTESSTTELQLAANGGGGIRLAYAEIDDTLCEASWKDEDTKSEVNLLASGMIDTHDREGKLYPLDPVRYRLSWDPNAIDDTGRIYGAMVVEVSEDLSSGTAPHQYFARGVFQAPPELQIDVDPTVVFVGLKPNGGGMRRTRVRVA